MSDDLKPCPFCGGKAIKIPDHNHSTGWEVGCFSGKCDVEPHVWAVHLETAVMQWNTRADADRIEQLNERLTAATDDAHEAEAYAQELEAKLTKAVEALRDTTQMLSQCTFTIIRMKGQYFERHDLVDKANAVLAELEGKK